MEVYDILYIDEKNSCRIMRGGFYETKKYKVYWPGVALRGGMYVCGSMWTG